MGIFTLIAVGLIAGWLSSFFVRPGKKKGLILNLILGVVGAFVGGYVMQFLGYAGVSGFNLYSILVATFGAIIIVVIGKILF
jgi:uncharacterized membrane protein YeaQ/YmgE (transglycosylase-associated protein family)